MHGKTEVYADIDSLSHAAAQGFIDLARRCIEQRGAFHVALAGGSTPKRLYEYLATAEFAKQLDWSRVHVYFGDERTVPHDHPDSNYHMASKALLSHVPIAAGHIHAFDTRLEVRHAAAAYARQLLHSVPRRDGLPQFDLILLGMGEDGHTASLFPRTCILHDERLAASVYVEKLHSWRLSLTYPVINNAEHVWLLVAGENKAAVLGRLNAGDDTQFPVAAVQPCGEMKWYLDEAAASALKA